MTQMKDVIIYALRHYYLSTYDTIVEFSIVDTKLHLVHLASNISPKRYEAVESIQLFLTASYAFQENPF